MFVFGFIYFSGVYLILLVSASKNTLISLIDLHWHVCQKSIDCKYLEPFLAIISTWSICLSLNQFHILLITIILKSGSCICQIYS